MREAWTTRPWAGLLLALLATAVAAAARAAMDPILGDRAQYTPFFLSVALVAFLAGWRAGLLAVLLGGAVGFWLFIYRPGRFEPGMAQDFLQLGLYAVTTAAISLLAGWGRLHQAEARRQAGQAARSERFKQAILDSLPAHVAVLDRHGIILAVNEPWLRFAHENGGRDVAIGVGVDYLMVCRKASDMGDATAREAMDGIRAVLEGQRSEFTFDYPCPSPHREQWFLMSVMPLGVPEGGVVVAHLDISERKRAEAAVAESSRAKDHFLAVLSHELRTPLTPVLTTAALMKEDAGLPQRHREDVELILRNVELESRLIEDLLDVTRIARGKLKLNRRPVVLGEVIDRTIEVCRADLQANDLLLDVDLDNTSRAVVDADPARLQQVFWNLLKNAIKFTPAGGRVSIRGRKAGEGRISVQVIDNGAGIDPAVLPRIFNAFEQGGVDTTRQFGGLGLGLAITSSLVEMHGGGIEAHSAGIGKGAAFTVTLPVLAMAHADLASGPAPEPQSPAPADVGPLRILLVEDHPDTARSMRRLLLTHGHEVELAGTVREAMDKATAEPPFDLLIGDLGLPDGSGLDLMRALRERGQNIPAIAASGFGQEQDIDRSRAAGFQAHLAKPISVVQLMDAIAHVVRASRMRG